MSKQTEFMGFAFDDEELHTPDAEIDLADITRAEFVRETVVDGEKPSTQETSPGAVAGGAIVGGALLGVAGAVGGGLLGSTVKEEVPGGPSIQTLSTTLIIESEDHKYSVNVTREQEVAAISFAKKLAGAAKRAQR